MQFNMRRKSGLGNGCLILFGFPFFAAGCFLLWFLVISPFLEYSKSGSWERVDCNITKSKLVSSSSSDGTTYRPEINYNYTYKGELYTSDSIDFSSGSSSSDRKAESKILKKFPKGEKRRCYVNPQNPSESVLVRDWGRGIFKWIAIPFGGVFAFTGLGLMLQGFFSLRKSRKKESVRGDVVLKPTGQRLGKIGGTFFICAFWNGIVSVFLIFWLAGLINGTAEGHFLTWGLGLFLTPFLIIGAFLFWKFIKELRNFWAPGIEVTLRQGTTWNCGDTVDIGWSIPLNASVDHLMIDFVCKESATYRRGTNTVTDTQIVGSIPVFADSNVRINGNCQFQIPTLIMPSFYSSNNMIQWFVRVRSDGYGPDADDSYPIDLRGRAL